MTNDTDETDSPDMSKYVLVSELDAIKEQHRETVKKLENELLKAKFTHSDEVSKVVSKWEDTLKAEKEQSKEELQSLRDELLFEETEHQVWFLRCSFSVNTFFKIMLVL